MLERRAHALDAAPARPAPASAHLSGDAAHQAVPPRSGRQRRPHDPQHGQAKRLRRSRTRSPGRRAAGTATNASRRPCLRARAPRIAAAPAARSACSEQAARVALPRATSWGAEPPQWWVTSMNREVADVPAGESGSGGTSRSPPSRGRSARRACRRSTTSRRTIRKAPTSQSAERSTVVVEVEVELLPWRLSRPRGGEQGLAEVAPGAGVCDRRRAAPRPCPAARRWPPRLPDGRRAPPPARRGFRLDLDVRVDRST